MRKPRTVAAILVMVALLAIVAACGSDEARPETAPGPTVSEGSPTPTGPNPQGTTEIGQALEAAEGSEVTVSGFLIADRDGNTRLCGGLLESGPPQCGGDRIDLLGFDASSVPNSETPQRPSEIGTSRWTNSKITVTGLKRIGGLAEVRLLTEAQATQDQPGEPAPGAQPVPPVSSSMMVPRPDSIEVLARMSHIIVLGTIGEVLDEIRFGAYGEDGNPYIPVEESGTPYTDYEVRVESVLKNDGDIEDGGTLVLRMFGHLSGQSDVITLAAVQLPQPGSHYLLALGRNPDGTYGSGNEGLIYVDGETVAYADGVAFSTELAGEEFVEVVRQEVDRNGSPPDLAHGSPPPRAPSGAPLHGDPGPSLHGSPPPPASSGAPLHGDPGPSLHGSPPPPASSGAPLHGDPGPSLKFGDVNYVHSGSADVPSGEGTVWVVIDGTEINVVDDLEVVGTTNERNTAGIQEGLVVYGLKGAGTNEVYTFRKGEDVVNPEDGQVFKGQDSWTRWTTR